MTSPTSWISPAEPREPCQPRAIDEKGEEGSTEPCDEGDVLAARAHCYAIFAERTGDPQPCRRLPTDTEEEQSLRDVCLSDVAGVVARAELCEEIETPGIRDSCYLKVSGETGDESLCAEIRDPGLASVCTGDEIPIEVEELDPHGAQGGMVQAGEIGSFEMIETPAA